MATEKWLIDANVLLNSETFTVSEGACKECENEYRWAIQEAPTVDAVEVVRCKDCVWCHTFEDLNYCENPKAPWIDDPDFDDITVAENDFCSYGERKNDG